MTDFKNSTIYKDYEAFKYIPSVDQLLDYRLKCMEKLLEDTGLEGFLKNEIKATDHLIELKLKEK